MFDRGHCENSTELERGLNPGENSNFFLPYIFGVPGENSHSNDSLKPLPRCGFVQLKPSMFVLILFQ